MKTFAFTQEIKQRKYGREVTQRIYRIKNNVPEQLGVNIYNTASCMGDYSECSNWLKNNGHIPAAWTDMGYYVYSLAEGKFSIYSL